MNQPSPLRQGALSPTAWTVETNTPTVKAHKVSVVSFGLFGDQGVFRSEATGAAEVVAGRFGGGPINVLSARLNLETKPQLSRANLLACLLRGC